MSLVLIFVLMELYCMEDKLLIYIVKYVLHKHVFSIDNTITCKKKYLKKIEL